MNTLEIAYNRCRSGKYDDRNLASLVEAVCDHTGKRWKDCVSIVQAYVTTECACALHDQPHVASVIAIAAKTHPAEVPVGHLAIMLDDGQMSPAKVRTVPTMTMRRVPIRQAGRGEWCHTDGIQWLLAPYAIHIGAWWLFHQLPPDRATYQSFAQYLDATMKGDDDNAA